MDGLTFQQVLERAAKTNPYAILVYHANREPLDRLAWERYLRWLEQGIGIHEISNPEAPMFRLAAKGYHKDHGVLVPRDKQTMLALLDLIPKIGDIVRDESGRLETVPGVDGKQVQGYPVRDPVTESCLVPMSTILRLWFPVNWIDPEEDIQKYLNAALRKSGFDPNSAAFRGAEAFYWGPKTPNILCFLAQPETVQHLMSERKDEFGHLLCPPGSLFAGLTAQPVYYRNAKITGSTCLEFGHYCLPPRYYPRNNEDKNKEG